MLAYARSRKEADEAKERNLKREAEAAPLRDAWDRMHGLRDKNRLQRADAEDSEAFPITQPNQFHTEPVIRLAFRSYGAKQARGDGIDDTHRGLEVLDAVGGAYVTVDRAVNDDGRHV